MKYIKWLDDVRITDVETVGGKSASIGEMISALSKKNIRVPSGFAVVANAYRLHLKKNNLEDDIISILSKLDKKNLTKLQSSGAKIRKMISDAPLPDELVSEISDAYKQFCKKYKDVSVAVRSSATAEDLPDASFAGQQETYLNITNEKSLLNACRDAFASLFTNRAISYREDHGFDHMSVALSVCVQKMVRADKASSGVAFTIDTESGFEDVIFINSAYGIGESIVKGEINPDEFYVHKKTLKNFRPILKKRLGSKDYKVTLNKKVKVPIKDQKLFSLSDDEILELARYCLSIEEHYDMPMDIEWAKDGIDNKIYIVQARPETVHAKKKKLVLEEYRLVKKSKEIITGKSVGKKIVSGKARVVASVKDIKKVLAGEILVTDMTDPDWEPIMKKAAGIITNRGGRTCHAAIVSREIGIPAIVGTTSATKVLKTGQQITLDCTGEVGVVYQGALEFEVKQTPIEKIPKLKTKIMMNVGNPDEAFGFATLPNDGVGLARLEFIINNSIGIHPMALVKPKEVSTRVLSKIEKITYGYKDKKEFFVDKLSQEVGTIVAAFYPKPVIVRLSDFKSNEYRSLLGGEFFEPDEENPMLGFRGASRYYHENYQDAFALECRAMRKIKEVMGLDNLKIMVPFVRTLDEGRKVIEVMKKHGLDGDFIMMCEVPSNVILLDEFAKLFNGFSIGSNDLTQLTLAVDRDSDLVASVFDERNLAVKKMLEMAITSAKKNNKPIGICGQAPSDYPEIAKFLIDLGIDSISLNPDTVVKTLIDLGS